MISAIVIFLGFAFGYLSYKNFRLASQVLTCLLPTYLIRINFGPLPSTALEVFFGFFTIVYVAKYLKQDKKTILEFFVKHRFFYYAILLFFISSIISIFISDMWFYSFGQWRAYFLEPIILFLFFIGRGKNLSHEDLLKGLSWSAGSVALFAIYQGLSKVGLDSAGRAVSFFTSPNAVGLYLAPLCVLNAKQLYDKKNYFSKNYFFLVWLPEFWLLALSLIAIYFTKSLGTIIGLFFALFFALIILKKKNFAVSLITGLFVSTLISFQLGFIPLQKFQSAGNRFTLWSYSFNFLTTSPKNYIFGTGLRQFFRKIQKPHYDVKKMERLIYPHNIFLNFWTEIGLFGMFGFAGIMACLLAFSRFIMRHGNLSSAAACFGIISVLLVHGLVDVPYFKNDLAILFWLLTAYIIKVKQSV